MIDFCHIVPTPHTDLTKDRETHLVLAHLIEENMEYRQFYANCGAQLIMDNSAFEMYKRDEPMYPTEKLIDMAENVGAQYVVMSDYPKEPIDKTINAAVDMIPQLKEAGFGTFFCPQSVQGDVEGLIASYSWAFHNPGIDYVAFSILNIPIAYNCESGAVSDELFGDTTWKMQKFLSRWKFMNELDKRFDLKEISKRKKFHFLGMTEGPNEIELMAPYHDYITTWDSSAAVWAGLNGIKFDDSPTGLHSGKFEKEVDFSIQFGDTTIAKYNMNYIDKLCGDCHYYD